MTLLVSRQGLILNESHFYPPRLALEQKIAEKCSWHGLCVKNHNIKHSLKICQKLEI